MGPGAPTVFADNKRIFIGDMVAYGKAPHDHN